MRAIILLVIAMAVYVNCRYQKVTGREQEPKRGSRTNFVSLDRRGIVHDHLNIDDFDDLVGRGIVTRRGRGRGVLRSIVDRRGIVHDHVDINSSDDLASRGIVSRRGKKGKVQSVNRRGIVHLQMNVDA